MSNAALKWAFALPVAKSSDKFVLVALANYADADGFCYPSQATLATDTALDRKTIITSLARLCASGYATDTGQRRGTTNQIIVYRLALEGVEARDDEPSNSPENGTGPENGTVPNFPRNSPKFPAKQSRFSRKQSQKRDTEPLEPSVEPSGTISTSREARATRLPDDWTPSDADRAFADRHGIDPDSEAEQFRDYWRGVPGARGRKADWPATWRNRIRQVAEYRTKRALDRTSAHDSRAWSARQMGLIDDDTGFVVIDGGRVA